MITERHPDPVRGADIAYYSFARLAKGPLLTGYVPEVPGLVIEIRSNSDRWVAIHETVAEYLAAGATAVVVLDSKTQIAHVFGAHDARMTLGTDDDLVLPDILEGVRVGRFFD